MKHLYFIILLCMVACVCTAQRDPLGLGGYRINKEKAYGFAAVALGGFLDGGAEAFTFDRKAFERNYGASPNGFFGSESWRMIYRDGDPANGVKSNLHRMLGAKDFYHVADDGRKLFYLTGAITLGIGGKKVNTKWWHYVVDAGIGYIVSGFFKSRAMNLVRHKTF